MSRQRDRRQPPGPPPESHLVRTGEWAGLRAGDPVDIRAGGRLRGATWAFVAFVRNARTGEEWVDVVGGAGGRRSLRSFRPDQVFAPSTRRRGAAGAELSLADAPQLPLD